MESYSHIELTEEESDIAILDAKIKKERRLEHENLSRIAEENRRKLNLISTGFTYDQMVDFAKYRATVLFQNKVLPKPFVIDEDNRHVFELLCMYFSKDKRFEDFGYNLEKGICLVGVPGVGKSVMMKLFSKNPRQCFYIKDCKQLSLRYQKDGQEVIDEYSEVIKAAINDKDVFLQPKIGICFSDLGTEDVKNSYGNKANVVGDILFERYKNNLVGDITHGETNLTVNQIEDFYGNRIRSRFSEMFNWIVLDGEDRRKL